MPLHNNVEIEYRHKFKFTYDENDTYYGNLSVTVSSQPLVNMAIKSGENISLKITIRWYKQDNTDIKLLHIFVYTVTRININ